MKVMIIGPMTGIQGFNYNSFFTAERMLHAQGFDVYDPANISDIDYRVDLPKHLYLKRSIKAMCTCHIVCALPNWKASVGAQKEMDVANTIGLEIIECYAWPGLCGWAYLLEGSHVEGRIRNGTVIEWKGVIQESRFQSSPLKVTVVAFVEGGHDPHEIFSLLNNIEDSRKVFNCTTTQDRYLVTHGRMWYAPNAEDI